MKYKKYSLLKFFREINTEEKARAMIWASRFGDKGFECPRCKSQDYYQLKSNPEIRECKACRHHLRVRVGTMFEQSHMPLLTWVRAIFLMTQGKRGVSALELQRQLELTRYETAWGLLHKIRHALEQRDHKYQIDGIIELDGAVFGKKATGTHKTVLVGVETKRWWTDDGKIKQRAGFAKVFMGAETTENIHQFTKDFVKPEATIKTDGLSSYMDTPPSVDMFSEVMDKDPKKLDYWLPWVHKFISNAKTWVLGTHHGVMPQYLNLYLAEYTYRFNRRHDPKGLFDRALTACASAMPVTLPRLTG